MIFVVCIKADIDKAVAAAKKAFQRGSVYRSMDASARAKLLWKYVKTSHHPFFLFDFSDTENSPLLTHANWRTRLDTFLLYCHYSQVGRFV